MKQIDVKTLQKMKLELTQKIIDLCKNNDIHIFLAYGTLIGAVREKGFIPWDEDMDFYMLRDDFEKFGNLSPKALGNDYFIQSYKTDNGMLVPIIRVCINGTYRCRKGFESSEGHKGTFVDVFPLDDASTDSLENEKNYKKCRNIFKKILFLHTTLMPKNIVKKASKKIIQFILSIPGTDVYKSKLDKCMKKFKGSNSGLLCDFAGEYGIKRETYKREWFKETVYLPFENIKLPCPCGYHELLTSVYGDYMIPPDEKNIKLDEPSYWID